MDVADGTHSGFDPGNSARTVPFGYAQRQRGLAVRLGWTAHGGDRERLGAERLGAERQLGLGTELPRRYRRQGKRGLPQTDRSAPGRPRRNGHVRVRYAPTQRTFVFVTPRQWSSKDHWVEQRRAEGKWADVLAYDANNLIAWLGQAPAVACARRNGLRAVQKGIGKLPSDGYTTVDEWWENWATVAEPSISPALVVAGRQDWWSPAEETRTDCRDGSSKRHPLTTCGRRQGKKLLRSWQHPRETATMLGEPPCSPDLSL